MTGCGYTIGPGFHRRTTWSYNPTRGTTIDRNDIQDTTPAGHDPFGALRERNYRLMLAGNTVANVGMQMQAVALGWEIYERTNSAMALGLVGLAQVVPVFLLVLPAGQVADRVSRRRIIIAALLVIAACSFGLLCVSRWQADVRWMYAILFLNGTARAFLQPARASFLPQIVPRARFSNAVTWNSFGFHLASIFGPALGGRLIKYLGAASTVYALDSACALTFAALMTQVVPRFTLAASPGNPQAPIAAGIAFLRGSPVVLAAITLDMFAVLLGGATALLPIYAKDILHVGPTGLGWLQAAPATGALMMALVLAWRPPLQRAGRDLLLAVVGFGLATIVFGLSRWFWLSLVMLFLIGALDNISVVVRHTLVQMLTPDHLRGRVSAINAMFINASNELGSFESGLVAAAFGPVVSAVSGGAGTLVVVAVVAAVWPQLRRYGRLGEPISERT